jgi:ferritin-like metal-binding protein YciE
LLAEALWIERILALEVLPALVREADSELLAQPLHEHLEQTRAHVTRVEEVFVSLGVEPVSAVSAALEGLRKQHDRHVGEAVEPRLRDLFLIDCAARTEAVEGQLYASLLALASGLEVDAAGPAQNRDEEDAALQSLHGVRSRLLERLG